jgi:cytochrome c biogenesis protein CcmG/thiol:disulfide interchange protein DsbE
MASEDTTTEPPTGFVGSPHPWRSQRARAVVGLLIALVIIAGSWYVGGRQGFDQVGRGGINRVLLPKVGEPAPDLVALAADDQVVTLAQFRGQPVWLNFWGSWCPPCRSEMPEMEAAFERLQPQGLVLLAVSLDESVDDAVSYARLNGATYQVAADPYRKGTAAYPIANFPTHILIDREGIVRDVVLAELNEAQVVERAAAILGRDGSQ